MVCQGLMSLVSGRSLQLLVATSLVLASLVVLSIGTSSGATWEPNVVVDQNLNFGSLGMSAAQNGMYVVTWVYDTGPVYLYRSTDDGASWSARKDVFGTSLWWAAPGVCSYSVGANDHLLVAANPGYVAKSVDGGNTFTRLTNLPLPPGVAWWGYPQLGTNASWHGGAPDTDIYAVGSMYLGEPWTGIHVLSFTKSHDSGMTWSAPIVLCDTNHTTYWPQFVSDGRDLYVIYTRLTTSVTYEGLYAMKSSDWGATWSSPARVVDYPSRGTFANSVQPINDNHAMLVIEDNGLNVTDGVMKYGYFDYVSMRFVEVGNETGSEWRFQYCQIGAHLAEDNDFQLAYVYDDGAGHKAIRYTHSLDSGLSRGTENPAIVSHPWTVARVGELYSFNASATPADNGTSDWSFNTNAPWLSIEWYNETNCLMTGVPGSTGNYWAELTVQDLNSSDSINWTIEVLPPPEVHWAPPTFVTPSSRYYFGLDLELGARDLYALSWVMGDGPVRLFRSGDNGTTWDAKNILGESVPAADPGMCVYDNGSSDVVLVVSGPGKVLKSDDDGESFSSLADLPTSSIAKSWRYLAIDTNASWFGGPPDDDVYVAGSRYIEWPTPMYAVSFTKSLDGGKTWKSPITLAGLSFATACPELVSDGSRLYVVYAGVDAAHSELYLRYSDDFGASWSAQQVLLRKQIGSEWIIPYSFQHLNDKRALLTLAEYGDFYDPSHVSIGRYGYFDFSTLRFQEAYNVSGAEWPICWGFAGKLKENNNLTLAWLRETDYPQNTLVFTYSLDAKVRAGEQPVAAFTISPPGGSTSTDFEFNASSCWDSDDPVEALEVRWDWEGDGLWDTDWSTEKTAHHVFSTAGNYSVTLEARDTDGMTSNVTIVLEVLDTEIPEFPSATAPVICVLIIIATMSSAAFRRRHGE